jgi:hypothetical protein
MTNNAKGKSRALRFGDLIAATYLPWGEKAKDLVRVLVKAHVVVFQGRQRFVAHEEQPENSIHTFNAK